MKYGYRGARRQHFEVTPKQEVPNFDATIDSLLKEPSLSAFESRFLASIKEQYSKSRGLSARQIEVFDKISKKYSPEAKEPASSWQKNFTATMAAKWDLAVRMYSGGRYFQGLLAKATSTPEYIPTEGEYTKITGNKFFARAWNEHQKPPKFECGDVVLAPFSPYRQLSFSFVGEACKYLRKTGLCEDASPLYFGKKEEEYLLIVGIDPSFVSCIPCVGMRAYRVQYITCNNEGSKSLLGKTFILQERHLKSIATKKRRGKKKKS